MIKLNFRDNTSIKVDCESNISKEMSEYFEFEVPGAKFNPKFKARLWDGKIRLYNSYTHILPFGLFDHVRDFASKLDEDFVIDDKIRDVISNPIDKDYLKSYINTLKLSTKGVKITPYEYQMDSIYDSLTSNRILLLSPTSSGKSLMLYCIVRYLLDHSLSEGNKILLMVPTIGLVTQMVNDFIDYSVLNGWDVDENIHQIIAGSEKESSKNVFVSTWQSLQKQKKEYFKKFQVLLGDEAHHYQSNVTSKLIGYMENCITRIGTTGSLSDSKTHHLTLTGIFGPIKKVISTKQLMDDGVITTLKINALVLKYPPKLGKEFKKAKVDYADEIKFLIQYKKRNDLLVDLVCKLKGNSLILFRFKEHGELLYKKIKDKVGNTKKIFLVHGDIDKDTREEIRIITDTNEDCIIVASIGTFATGISIRTLKHLVFAHPSKSRIKVLQSIGRILRKMIGKEIAILWDISDDISYLKHKNYTLKHFLERVNLYNEEKHEYSIKILNI